MRRTSERGTAMVVMLIVLVALGTIAGLTVISVQGGSATTNTQRFSSMALYAAESGAAAAMDWLRTQYVGSSGSAGSGSGSDAAFSAIVNPNNTPAVVPAAIPGNTIQPGVTGNLLSNDQQGWYEVTILNNRGDTGLGSGEDYDGVVILQVTGHGPNGAVKQLEWEVLGYYELGSPTATPGVKLELIGWREMF